MGKRMRVILSIDTEGDNLWAKSDVPSYRNVERLPDFQEFCEGLGLRPTYLVAYEVLEDDRARETIRQLARSANCEIGAHLHAWLTPPAYPALETPSRRPYLHEYPEDLRRAKLEATSDALEEILGRRPTSYRGGRWSMDAFTMRTLDEMGYLADTTVTPYVSWVRARGGAGGGPNFVHAPHTFYHPASSNPTEPGGLKILEVPTSSRPRNLLPNNFYKALGKRFGSNASQWRRAQRCFLNRLGKVVFPNPATETRDRLLWLVRHVSADATPYLNLAFHSSELMAGGAPWVRDKADQAAVWSTLDAVTKAKPVEGATLTEFASCAGQCREEDARLGRQGTPAAGSR